MNPTPLQAVAYVILTIAAMGLFVMFVAGSFNLEFFYAILRIALVGVVLLGIHYWPQLTKRG